MECGRRESKTHSAAPRANFRGLWPVAEEAQPGDAEKPFSGVASGFVTRLWASQPLRRSTFRFLVTESLPLGSLGDYL